jgi:hypothetical protein
MYQTFDVMGEGKNFWEINQAYAFNGHAVALCS